MVDLQLLQDKALQQDHTPPSFFSWCTAVTGTPIVRYRLYRHTVHSLLLVLRTRSTKYSQYNFCDATDTRLQCTKYSMTVMASAGKHRHVRRRKTV